MNELTTINGFSGLELEAMHRLPEYQRFYIEPKNEIKIIHSDKQEVLTQLYAIVIKTIELSGENKKYNLDNQTIKNVAGFIYDYVLQHYKGATLSELKNAFKLGISGEYGDFVGFGTVTFTKFIKAYMTMPRREMAIKEWMKHQNVNLTTSKPITKFFDKNMDIANYFFSICEVKNSERFDTIVNHEDQVMFLPAIYDFLNDNYKIVFSDESYEKIKHQAKVRYNKFIIKSDLKKTNKSAYDMIIKSVVEGNNRTFEYYYKLEALIFLTLKLKEQGKTYKDLKPIN